MAAQEFNSCHSVHNAHCVLLLHSQKYLGTEPILDLHLDLLSVHPGGSRGGQDRGLDVSVVELEEDP